MTKTFVLLINFIKFVTVLIVNLTFIDMNMSVKEYVEQFMADIVAKNPGEVEFHQAVKEVVESVAPYVIENPQLMKMKVLERIAEPERVILFRVPWVNDKGEVMINKGYRVQMNSAIGPYKARAL